ncbi:tripartite tricarboxylate transporter permease [uncultured Nisaea sp.]|jgi:putative tricarboxylic transport membrane protein|uniref:tripartite tricarboxylate transporter permease n=1 Tax=uncultured Nisaea sp. TaxID=538215 RepID=UPI0030ECCA5E|tara:strand:- start:12158 stop:13846 length:1689 start_codon:yes stop_codon:yes gene_type:complete
MIDTLMYAFADVFAPWNLVLMTVGVTAGLIAGAIPGFTIAMAVVLTLPFTFGLSPVEGLSTMIGVYVGGLSGGLMSGMLTGIPGTPSSIATTFDGFPMARNGKPGLALGLGVWSSFFGGMFSAVLLVTLAPRLAVIGLEFGPWDYFSLVLFALTITASLSGENLVKGMIAGALGLFIATVGEDEVNGVARFSFGFEDLESGFTFLPVLIGLFAFSQLLSDLQDRVKARQPLMDARGADARVRIEHVNAIKMVFARWVNLLRSSFIGVFTGVLPAAGSSISNILAYDQAKKASKTPEKFGTGTPDGIIAPEASNNATAGGALITMMALGIPGDIITAVMLGALLIHNVQPSPTFITDNPDLAYAIFVAFFLAHFIMIAMQSVTLRLFVMVTRIPMYMLASVILAYCAIGVFALNNITYDIWVLFSFGIVGYVMRQLGFPLAPIILGVVLGHVAELNLSRSLATDSDLMLFITRPWSLFFLIVSAFSIGFPWYQKARETKAWTLAYVPVLLAAISVPLFMMEGFVRPIIGVALLALSAYLLWRSVASGWKVAPSGDHEVHLEES